MRADVQLPYVWGVLSHAKCALPTCQKEEPRYPAGKQELVRDGDVSLFRLSTRIE